MAANAMMRTKSVTKSVEERVWKRPDLPSNCTWETGKPCPEHPDDSPHHHLKPNLTNARVYDDVLKCIGDTPLVKVRPEWGIFGTCCFEGKGRRLFTLLLKVGQRGGRRVEAALVRPRDLFEEGASRSL